MAIASQSSVDYLKTLFAERFGKDLPASEFEGAEQVAVSAKIKTLLATDGILPASPEQASRVAELANSLGITVEPPRTSAQANRQIRSMERDINVRAYHASASDFGAFLSTLASEGIEITAPVAVTAAPSADDIPWGD